MTHDEPVKTSTLAMLRAGLTHRANQTKISIIYGEKNTPCLMTMNNWLKEPDKDTDPAKLDNDYPKESYAIQAITSFPFLRFGKVNFAFPVALPLQDRIIAASNSPTGFDGIISAIQLAKIYVPIPPEKIIISDNVLSIDPTLLEIGGREVIEGIAGAKVIISTELDSTNQDYSKILKFLNI